MCSSKYAEGEGDLRAVLTISLKKEHVIPAFFCAITELGEGKRPH